MFKVNVYYPDGRFFYSSKDITTKEEAVATYDRQVSVATPGYKVELTKSVVCASYKAPANTR